MGIVNVETARNLMQSVIARSEQLQQTAAARDLRVQRQSNWSRQWRLLRQSVRRLNMLLRSPKGTNLTPDVAEWESRRTHLEDRARTGEEMLDSLDEMQCRLDAQWLRIWQELEGIHEEWRLLQAQSESKDFAKSAVLEVRVHEKVAKLEALWAQVIEEDSQVMRERTALRGEWNRLIASILPALETAAAGTSAGKGWIRIAEQLRAIDKRWANFKDVLRTPLNEEQASIFRERAALIEERAQKLSEEIKYQVEPTKLKNAELQTELDKSLAQKRGLESDLKLAQGEISVIREDLRKSRQERDKFEKAVRTAQLSFETAKSELLSSQNDLDLARNALKEVQQERDRLKVSFDSASSALKNLQSNVTISEREQTLLKQQADFIQQKLSSTSKELDLLGKKYSDALTTLQQTKESRDAALKTLEATIAERDRLAQDLTATRQNLNVGHIEILPHEKRLESRPFLPPAPPTPTIEAQKTQSAELESSNKERDRLAKELAAAQQALEQARRDLAAVKNDFAAHLKANLAQADQPEHAPAAEIPPSDAVKEAPTLSAGPSEELPAAPIPSMESVEPVLDPVWGRVIQTLRQSLVNAYAHLRRLSASPLKDGQKTLVRMAAASLSAAQDTLKVAAEFLEDGIGEVKPGRLEPSLETALSAWEPFFRARGAAVVRRIERDISPVMFHQESFRVVLYQILKNAYEAMPRGGCLTVILRWDAAAGQASLSFSDTGPGFAKNVVDKLFIPFGTGKTGHLGLGLALVRRVMRRLGGDAEAANATPTGAVVTLKFSPASGQTPPLAQRPID